MTPAEHYAEAERLLAEGVVVVEEIRDVPLHHTAREIGPRRDALGKQAMGIWAQAQVHATLATAKTMYRPASVQFPASDPSRRCYADTWVSGVRLRCVLEIAHEGNHTAATEWEIHK